MEHYDKLYSSEKNVFGGGKPEEVVIRGANLLPKDAEIIEFGAGQGRNALALAERGFKVKAVEISTVGVESINSIAKEKGLANIETVVGDVRDGVEGEYDMIVTTFMFHHLSRADGLKFVEEIKQHTKPGGLNALTAFTKEGDFYKLKTAEGQFYPNLGELRSLYSDWEVIEYEESNSRAQATTADGKPMFNIKAVILARRIS